MRLGAILLVLAIALPLIADDPKDVEKQREALAYLDARRLDATIDQLRRSAMEAEPQDVQALIDAGVDVNEGPAGDRPLNSVLSACAYQEGENEAILETLDVLLAAGADVKALDDNQNTPLITAAQYCSDGAVTRLLAKGADPNATNGSGVNPLTMALIMNRLDAAEALVSGGARLTADQATMVSGMATSERARAIVKKASPKKKK